MTSAERKRRKDERAADAARMAQLKEDSRRTVAGGVCPSCGTRLVRNNSMAGWWQCGAYGMRSFRLPEHKDKPFCSFQCFTE